MSEMIGADLGTGMAFRKVLGVFLLKVREDMFVQFDNDLVIEKNFEMVLRNGRNSQNQNNVIL